MANRTALCVVDNDTEPLPSGDTLTDAGGNAIGGGGGGDGITWNTITSSQTAAVNNGYILNSTSQIALTLPGTAAIGDRIKIRTRNTGGARLTIPSGSTVYYGSSAISGADNIDSVDTYSTIDLECINTNSDWAISGGTGRFGSVGIDPLHSMVFDNSGIF